MLVPGKSPSVSRGPKMSARTVIAAIAFVTPALADPPRQMQNASRPIAARTSKCICGYGLSGYDGLTCVPVKDCEWERGVCRGKC
jgi:hypothetical protein